MPVENLLSTESLFSQLSILLSVQACMYYTSIRNKCLVTLPRGNVAVFVTVCKSRSFCQPDAITQRSLWTQGQGPSDDTGKLIIEIVPIMHVF